MTGLPNLHTSRRGGRVRPRYLSILPIALILLPTEAWAGRPLLTDDAVNVGQGVVQLEVGLDHAREDGGDRETTLTAVFTYGLADTLDLALQLPFLFLEPAEEGHQAGIGDIEVHGKYRIVNEGAVSPAFAVTGALKFPTGSERRGLGSGATDVGITLVATKGFGPVTAHLNLGYTVIGAPGQENVLRWGAAAALKVTEPLSFVGEVIGQTNSDPHAKDDPREVRVGLAYALRGNIVLDGAVSLGLTRASPDYVLTVGITARFE